MVSWCEVLSKDSKEKSPMIDNDFTKKQKYLTLQYLSQIVDTHKKEHWEKNPLSRGNT